MGDVIEYLDYTPGPYDVYKNNMLIGEFINWVKEQYPERWREILDVINNDPKNMAAFLTYVNPAHPSNVDSAINEIRNNASVKYYYVTKNSTTVGKGKSVIYENGKIKTDRYGKVIYTKDHRTYYSSFVKFNPNDLIISTGKTSRTVAKSPLILLEGIASVFKDNGINVQIVDDDFFKERGIISETGTYPKAYTSRGIVYLNKMRCTTTDAIHEYSHLLLSIPRIKNPKLYEEILMKFKDEYPGINELTQEKI